MNKNIWIISEYYYPVVTSTGYYITEIAESLAKNKNLNVHVISTGVTYNEPDSYSFLKKEERNNVSIERIISANINKDKFYQRSVRLLISSFFLAIRILKRVKKGDEVLMVTNPVFLVLFIPFLKKIKKVKCTLLVHDIFPENLAAIDKISKGSVFYKLLKSSFDRAYQSADTCISIGRDMSKIIERKIKTNSSIELITNWADNDSVFPLEKNNTELITSLGLQEKTIFQFAGNLGHAQGIDNMLKAIEMIEDPSLHFLFVGGGAKKEEVASFAEKNPMKNVTLVNFQERFKQGDFLNACDVAIVTLNQSMLGLGVPSKSYNIMAVGKPMLVIADSASEIAMCVEEYEIGWVVEPGNPVALKNIIEEIGQCRNQLAEMGKNARILADTIFSKEKILDKYHQLFANENHN